MDTGEFPSLVIPLLRPALEHFPSRKIKNRFPDSGWGLTGDNLRFPLRFRASAGPRSGKAPHLKSIHESRFLRTTRKVP